MAGNIQTNFRLPQDQYEILEAAAYVQKAGSVTHLVRDLVEAAIDGYSQLPSVQKALEAQREQTAVEEGKVTPLPAPRRKAE